VDTLVLDRVQERLGLKFHNVRLLEQALTPFLLATEKEPNPEFLKLTCRGRSLLDWLVMDSICEADSATKEEIDAQSAAMRSTSVRGEAALALGMVEFQNVTKQQLKRLMSGRQDGLPAHGASLLHATVAVIYLDAGHDVAQWLFAGKILPVLRAAIPDPGFNPRLWLGRILWKARRVRPEYRQSGATGSGSSRYTFVLQLPGALATPGTGRTKKAAMDAAALSYLEERFGVTNLAEAEAKLRSL
jgi:dsRNA-specific ribonuclease